MGSISWVLVVGALLLGPSAARSSCHDEEVRKSTLKLVKESPFVGLFRDLKGHTKFEASGVALVNGSYFVVFDSSNSLGYLDDRFQFRDPANRLIGEPGGESQFEGIAYVPENDTFLLVHEALEHKGGYKPFITTAKIRADHIDYDVASKCEVDFELEHSNKGLESILYVRNSKGSYLLGLCEGNHCKGGRRGREAGHGRILVLELDSAACRWKHIRTLRVPPTAAFQDFAGMALDDATGRLAILSQEDAALWIGKFDVEQLSFDDVDGDVVHLPRNEHCEIIYCNAEGVQWIDASRIMVVSDKAKSSQPFHCDEKDQSVHIFALPALTQDYIATENHSF